jgi:hypothetical protein
MDTRLVYTSSQLTLRPAMRHPGAGTPGQYTSTTSTAPPVLWTRERAEPNVTINTRYPLHGPRPLQSILAETRSSIAVEPKPGKPYPPHLIPKIHQLSYRSTCPADAGRAAPSLSGWRGVLSTCGTSRGEFLPFSSFPRRFLSSQREILPQLSRIRTNRAGSKVKWQVCRLE